MNGYMFLSMIIKVLLDKFLRNVIENFGYYLKSSYVKVLEVNSSRKILVKNVYFLRGLEICSYKGFFVFNFG